MFSLSDHNLSLQGRFTFKNGRYYEGLFESDHIKEYPNFDMDGASTPDQTAIRTRTPLPMGKLYIIAARQERQQMCM